MFNGLDFFAACGVVVAIVLLMNRSLEVKSQELENASILLNADS